MTVNITNIVNFLTYFDKNTLFTSDLERQLRTL